LWLLGNDSGTGGVEILVKEELCEKVVEVRRKTDSDGYGYGFWRKSGEGSMFIWTTIWKNNRRETSFLSLIGIWDFVVLVK